MNINLTQKSLGNIFSNINNLSSKNVLDIFAREGDWQTKFLVDKVKSIEGWEINEEFVTNLKNNFPTIKAVLRNSIEYIKNTDEINTNKFDIVVVDNGMNCYGVNDVYCEHFDFIHDIHKFFNDEVYLILNVAKSPFNYNNFPNWIKRREKFYGINSTENISLEFLMDFYKNIFLKNNFKCKNLYVEPRELHKDNLYLYHFCFKLERVK
tara:strand:+ start:115 stop:741 length:627 start_codon:yes stop_codon:yes gene_type:complete